MKPLIPTPANRAACSELLWEKLHLEQGGQSSLSSSFDALDGYLREGSAAKAAVTANDVAAAYMNGAMIERRRLAADPADALLRKSFAFAYWSRELNMLARRDPGWYELSGDDLLMPLATWQGLSTVCGASWFALWLAPHLHNQFGYPNEEMPTVYYSLDKPARRFMELLQRSLITGQWPDTIDAESMAGYGRMLQACDRPAAWPGALVDFCDWRVANAYGYPEMGAPKRRKQSSMLSVLDVERIEQVFPVELLTLRFAYERATGRTLSLDAPHPLLQSSLMTLPFPSVEPLYEDEWTAKMKALRESGNGRALALRSPVEAKYL